MSFGSVTVISIAQLRVYDCTQAVPHAAWPPSDAHNRRLAYRSLLQAWTHPGWAQLESSGNRAERVVQSVFYTSLPVSVGLQEWAVLHTPLMRSPVRSEDVVKSHLAVYSTC